VYSLNLLRCQWLITASRDALYTHTRSRKLVVYMILVLYTL
jgi:hypothetical protein